MTSGDPRPLGLRVVLDVRALQEPARAPRTAAYLEGLLGAFDADDAATAGALGAAESATEPGRPEPS